MINSYQGFAALYDALTFDVDYENIAAFIQNRLQENGITSGLVLDLACGTGTLTLALSAYGYEMLGADFPIREQLSPFAAMRVPALRVIAAPLP